MSVEHEILVSPIIEDLRPVQGSHGLAPEQVGRVLKLIRSGVSIRRALSAVQVSSAKFTRWKERADKGVYPYADLFEKLAAAEDQYLASCEQILADQMSDGDAMVALKILERRDPATYAPRTQADINANFAITSGDLLAQLMASIGGVTETLEIEGQETYLLEPVNDYVAPELTYGGEDDSED